MEPSGRSRRIGLLTDRSSVPAGSKARLGILVLPSKPQWVGYRPSSGHNRAKSIECIRSLRHARRVGHESRRADLVVVEAAYLVNRLIWSYVRVSAWPPLGVTFVRLPRLSY